MAPDANGVIPLHIAVWHKAPRPVIDAMLSAAPEAKNMKTSSGYYALDYGKLFNAEDEELLRQLEVRSSGSVVYVGVGIG